MIRCDRHAEAEPIETCGACETLRAEYRTLGITGEDDPRPYSDPARAHVVGNTIAFELIQHDPNPSRIPAVVREMSDDPRATQRELILVEVIVALHTIAREYYRLSRAKSTDEALAMTKRIEGVLSERLGWDLEALWELDQ